MEDVWCQQKEICFPLWKAFLKVCPSMAQTGMHVPIDSQTKLRKSEGESTENFQKITNVHFCTYSWTNICSLQYIGPCCTTQTVHSVQQCYDLSALYLIPHRSSNTSTMTRLFVHVVIIPVRGSHSSPQAGAAHSVPFFQHLFHSSTSSAPWALSCSYWSIHTGLNNDSQWNNWERHTRRTKAS